RGRGGGAANFLGGSDRRWDKAVFGVAVAESAVPARPPAVRGAVGGEPAGVIRPGGYGRESEVTCDRGGDETVVAVAVAESAVPARPSAVRGAGGGEPAGMRASGR